jgi:hypothetical protein
VRGIVAASGGIEFMAAREGCVMGFFSGRKKRAGLSLMEAAGAASYHIFQASLACADFVKEVAEEATDEWIKCDKGIYWKVVAEAVCYHYHCALRKSYETVDEDTRMEFMAALARLTAQCCAETLVEQGLASVMEECKAAMLDDLMQSSREYAPYPWLHSDNPKKRRGTVAWEFGKKVAQVVGCEDYDLSFMLGFWGLAISTVGELPIEGILKDMR